MSEKITKENSFRNFISAMKIEKTVKNEGFEIIDYKDLGNEQFFYLKKKVPENDK